MRWTGRSVHPPLVQPSTQPLDPSGPVALLVINKPVQPDFPMGTVESKASPVATRLKARLGR